MKFLLQMNSLLNIEYVNSLNQKYMLDGIAPEKLLYCNINFSRDDKSPKILISPSNCP